ncbi:uncharacterized protein LOC132742584 [Ruditapes philippinarum]|uniref:uncharacterized protein LOC132742584 n=1 Tax=Ruditapes philippinarum TaxID=129788 RepID=UPI00295B5EF9|nr:uncharacterized protein LOC132742584 [Ruditapes philippinarum]
MQGNESTLENIVGFRRLNVLDGYSCPVNNTIKVENQENKLLCLILCSKLSSCKGVYILPDSKERCVMCSATFFTIDISQEISTTRQFYKRIRRSRNNVTTSGVSAYSFAKEQLNWTSAEENCKSYGGHLAKIISDEENEYVVNVSASYQYGIWIGGYGVGGPVDTFRWWDGSRLVDGYDN